MQNISSKELTKYPLVALVGRVNVGKSTFFNLLVSEKKALTAPVPGTTRDVNYGFCEWRGKKFVVADSGGFMAKPITDIDKKVAQHMQGLLKKAKLVLFLVDVQEGMNPEDRVFLKIIRQQSKAPIMLVANKADALRHIQESQTSEWLKLGLGAPMPVSAASGLGSGDLLDSVLDKLSFKEIVKKSDLEPIKIALIGRTNVGKSSILNRILGEDRVIVSDMPHTTREPQDMLIYYGDQPITLIDTVGIRRKNRVEVGLEREGVMRSIKSIKKADLVFLVVESQVAPSKQELRLARIAADAGSGIIILVNKWDLIEEKKSNSIKAFEGYFRKYFAFIAWSPLLFISALKGQRVHKIIELAMEVKKSRE